MFVNDAICTHQHTCYTSNIPCMARSMTIFFIHIVMYCSESTTIFVCLLSCSYHVIIIILIYCTTHIFSVFLLLQTFDITECSTFELRSDIITVAAYQVQKCNCVFNYIAGIEKPKVWYFLALF